MTDSASSRAGSTAWWRLQTKQGYDYADRYPLIVEAIARLKVTSILIDGEAMCFTGAEHDFDKLWNRTHDHEAKLCAFDLLELDGEDYRPKPLADRKRQLFKLLRRAWRGIDLEGDGAVIFEHACKLGWRALSASGSTCLTGPARQRAGSRSRTRNTRPCCASKKRLSWRGRAVPKAIDVARPYQLLFGAVHQNQCPRCGGAMVCYVSSPVAFGMIERRLYFSCACGMIAAHNEEDIVTSSGT